MGKKYIIEMEDLMFRKTGESGTDAYLWRVKGFNSLVFDMTGINKLTPYTEPNFERVRKETYEDGYKTAKVQCNIQAEKDLREVGKRHYQKGLSDAWEAARKVSHCALWDDYRTDTGKLSVYTGDVLDYYTAAEAIEKLKAYEQEQFHVGDEFETENGKKYVVLKMDGKEIDRYMDSDGRTYHMNVKYKVMRKTGRHFSEIATVLEKMRGENND